VQIDVWSDLVCPWCYLGKRRLDGALDQLDWRAEVEVRWRAYQLDPNASDDPGDLRATMEAKYGPGAYQQMTLRLVDLGSRDGIDYRFDLAQRTNTRRGHQLVAAAWNVGGADAQDRLVERLFRAYFTEGVHLGDDASLQRLWTEAGLPGALPGDEHDSEVQADLDAAARFQLRGVPAFVIDARHLISGAQETDTLRQALEQIRVAETTAT
jgi:predicted DsbA family dithiol-disulfide isomerase